MMRAYNSKLIPVYRELSDKMYVEDIERISPAVFFTDEQIRQLIKEYRKTNNERLFLVLVHSFSKYVVSIAKNYQEQGLYLGDLISEGMIGLISSIENFDLSNKTKFVTYSNIVISRYMREALDYTNNIVKLPKNIRNNRSKTKELISIAQMEGVNEENIADKIDDENLIFFSNPDIFTKRSLSDYINEDNTVTVEDTLVSEESSPDSGLTSEDLRRDIQNVLKNILSPDEVRVIVLFFGLELPYEITSIVDLSKRLKLPKDTIKSLKDSAFQKLKGEDCIKILGKYV